MKQMLKKIFLNNTQIKIISLILGYCFWYVVSQSHVSNITIDVPICFYKINSDLQIEAPEKIKIQLSAKRADLYTINMETLAFHINMQDVTQGDHVLKLSEEQLLLPESIKLARCYPANICIAIKKREKSS